MKRKTRAGVSAVLIATGWLLAGIGAPGSPTATGLDGRVKQFLSSKAGKWWDMNIPASDGQLLYDLILQNKYRQALEIGTSTGHSGIWMAWALSKTGGKLITIEIDESRHREAVANFRAAGLAEYVDARLADAHELVPALAGPFDFVFCDADKEWYQNYFLAAAPKLAPGGCFAAHNVRSSGWQQRGLANYLKFVREQPGFTTRVDDSGGGMAISVKKTGN